MSIVVGWLMFIASVIGHAEWWIMSVNRTHALPIRATKLRKFRSLHDAAVVGYPFILMWLTGPGEHSLLRGGSFAQQSVTTQWCLIITWLGCIPLLFGILRWQFIRRRQFLAATDRRMINVLAEAQSSNFPDEHSESRVRGTRKSTLHRVPRSEIFHLEVNRKIVRPRRLNGATRSESPLRVVHVSDLHFIGCPGEAFYRRMVDEMIALRPEVIIFSGDLIDRLDLLPQAIEILQPLTSIAPSFFILGNHDWRYDFEMIRAELVASGWNCVTGVSSILRVAGRTILLAGTERPWMGTHPPDVTHAGADLKLLVSHSPDQIRFAKRCGYDLMLSGHTHGGQVVLPIVGPVYSPSLYGVSFVSGLFQLGSLTLHVTRGIGAKDSLRLNCSPEITCLEVHC